MILREYTINITNKDLNHLLSLSYAAGGNNLDEKEARSLVNGALNLLIDRGDVKLVDYTKPKE